MEQTETAFMDGNGSRMPLDVLRVYNQTYANYVSAIRELYGRTFKLKNGASSSVFGSPDAGLVAEQSATKAAKDARCVKWEAGHDGVDQTGAPIPKRDRKAAASQGEPLRYGRRPRRAPSVHGESPAGTPRASPRLSSRSARCPARRRAGLPRPSFRS